MAQLAVDGASFLPRQEGVLKAYLEKVRVWHGYARFIGLPALVDTSKDVPLERLYVPPRLSTGAIQPETMNEPADKLPPTLGLLESLMAHPRLVVLGDPGSGKSTLINYIADSLSRPSHSELRTRLGADIVPLPFILRELGIGEDITWDSLCTAFLARPVGQTLGKDDSERRQNLDALLHSGQGWVMLDGLDEIGSASVRGKLRDLYFEAEGAFPHTRFLLTSRIVGYEEVAFDMAKEDIPIMGDSMIRRRIAMGDFESQQTYREYIRRFGSSRILPNTQRLYLAPFNDEQVRDFTRHWWMHHRGNPAIAAAESEEFLAALHAKKDTRTLGRVPNLLVLIALVYKVFVKLPDGRAELFWKIAEAYLENIDRSYQMKKRLPHGFRQMASWLGHVAWKMQLRRHQEASQEKNKNQETTRTEILITHDEALDHLTKAIQQEVSSEAEAHSLAVTFLDYAARRSGLFIPRGVDVQQQELYAFMHLSFQEFFCAVYLQERIGRMSWWEENVLEHVDASDSASPALRQYAARTEWTEVFVFLFEMLKLGDPDKPARFLRVLLNETPRGNDWHSFDAPFPEIPGDKPESPAHPLRLPHAHLVELAAILAMNSEVRLTSSTRQQLLHHAWDWETRRCMDGHQVWFEGNAVARVLLARRADLSSSCQALANLGASVQQLTLTGCTAISDLQPLQALASIQHLNLSGCTAVSDLQPLQALASLQHLNLSGCTAVSDLQPLQTLASLQYLFLTGCAAVSDLQPLQTLASLQYLRLDGCTAVSDLQPLQPLQALASLQSLDLDGCTAVSDLQPLQVLASLQHLYLNGCTAVSNLQPLQALVSLQHLFLAGCTAVSDLQPLQALASLEYLFLNGCTAVSNLQPLQALASIQHLFLTGCTAVSDLQPLQALASLQSLDLTGCTGVKDSPIIAQLKKRKVRVTGP